MYPVLTAVVASVLPMRRACIVHWPLPISARGARVAGNDPNLQHGKGVGINRKTWAWNSAAAVFAYGYGSLAELGYKYVGKSSS